jgi:pimeloyl-ACP methyl ester carboxylesterase
MLKRPPVRSCAAIVLLAFVGGLLAAPRPRPSVAVPPPTDPAPAGGAATQAATRPTWPPVPRDVLTTLYRTELGPLFRPESADAYFRAHELIERYFETAKLAERKQVVRALEATELPPGVIGRLCRLRMYWPALDAGGVYYVNEKTGVFPTRYFFGVPVGYDRAKAWPLVLKLPTAQAFLTDPPPTAAQVTEIYTKWVKEELAAHPDAVVVMPLLNLDELWGPSYAGMNAVLLPMQHVAGRANVDPARVYVVGHSMSAHAAWNLALHYPTYFAAVNPLAGGASAEWQRLRAANLRNVLPVAWHDADDQVIKVDASRGIVKALRAQKVDVEYEETKGIGHVPDAATAERAYAKMRARTRDLYPPAVALRSNRPDTMFNRSDWVQVYQPANPGADHRVGFGYGSGSMVYTDNIWGVAGTRSGNRVDVRADNVDSLRIYLNDQMADLSQPVTVAVNGKARTAAVVKQSVDELMKDQAFLGRGWRYYTAVVDVELTARPPAPATRSTTGAAAGGGRPATVPTLR